MPEITVPSSFFRSERNSIYSDWRSAFWRELLSNSLDAGADRIRMRMSFKEKSLVLDMIDNGSGMSRDVLQNTYMRLGASTKSDGDGIGGFGRARILTCFSQDGYSIRSADYHVKGQGASYEILDATPIKGCAISISMPENEARRIYAGLAKVLRQSSLRAAIEVKLDPNPPGHLYIPDSLETGFGEPDDKGWKRFRGWSRMGKHLETLSDEKGPWADLHVNDGAACQKHCSIIRVNGMSMYDDYISIPSQVTVSLIPSRAREVLTASRDAIRSPYRDILQEIYQRISSEKLSGLRKKPVDPVTELRAPGATFDRHGFLAPVASRNLSASLDRNLQIKQDTALPSGLSMEALLRGVPDQPEQDQDDVGFLYPLALHIGEPTSAQRAASERHAGTTWLSDGNEGRSSELIHAAWTAACRHSIKKLVDLYPHILDPQRDRWVTGFVFDREMAACHMRIGDIEHGLLLNPVDAEGRLRFKLSDPSSMKRMISEAIHEVSHIASRRHDEFFACVLTDIMGATRDRDIEREVKEELDRMREHQNVRQARIASRTRSVEPEI